MNVWAVPVEHPPMVLKERPKKDPVKTAERKTEVLEKAKGLKVTKK